MIVGVPKEMKSDEYRVAMLPSGVEELVHAGHQVLVEHNAGAGSGISDDDYVASGATIAKTHAEVFSAADLIVKVKEPMRNEWPLLRAGQTVFTFFHFAADEELTRNLLESRITAVAYETLQGRNKDLPLLRHEHAWGCRSDQHLRTLQCHISVCPANRQRRSARGMSQRPWPCRGSESAQWANHQPRCGGDFWFTIRSVQRSADCVVGQV